MVGTDTGVKIFKRMTIVAVALIAAIMLLVFFTSGTGSSPIETADNGVDDSRDAIVTITSAYNEKHVFSEAIRTSCSLELVGNYKVIGCRGGDSFPQLWVWQQAPESKFLALNGPASGVAEKYFAFDSRFGSMPLPLPEDLDFDKSLKAFE